MIVMCEGCETSFNVEDRLIKAGGSRVRCSKCRHVFTAYPPAIDLDAEEPLTLENELPMHESDAQLKEIDSTLDALFNEGPSATAPAAAEPEMLDVDDLLAEDAPAAAAAPGDDLGLDLDLGLDIEEEGPKAPVMAAPAPSGPADDIAIDFNLDLEPPKENAHQDDGLPDLDELEINLDELDQPLQAPAAAAAGDAPVEPGELELDLDFDALAAETSEPVEPAVGLDPVAAAAGEAASAGPAPPPGPAGEDELDLSDLEAMLAGDMGRGQPATRAGTEGIDLELDLDSETPMALKPEEMEALDLTAIAGEPEPAAPAADAPDLGLLAESEEATVPTMPSDDELDFSDLAGILGEPGAEAEKATAAEPSPELDLVFDETPAAAAGAAKPEAPAPSEDDLMLDLESLLEEGEQKEKAAADAPLSESTEELDLDFADAPKPMESSDLEIEIEPVGEATDVHVPFEQPVAAAAMGAVAAGAAVAGAAAAIGKGKPAPAGIELAPSVAADLNLTGATSVLETEAEPAPVVAPRIKPRPVAQPSGLRKVLVGAFAAVVLVLLALGIPRTLGVYVPFLSDTDIPLLSELDVPGLGKVFEPVYDDPTGILKIAPLPETVTAEFVDHPAAGRLCVVRGQLKNAYDHPRSYLQVTSKLLDKNRQVAKTATVFAGNVLSNQDLTALDLGAINARLKNRNGTANQNVGVKPGKAIPFMVVFDGLPPNLDEYSVEAAASSK